MAYQRNEQWRVVNLCKHPIVLVGLDGIEHEYPGHPTPAEVEYTPGESMIYEGIPCGVTLPNTWGAVRNVPPSDVEVPDGHIRVGYIAPPYYQHPERTIRCFDDFCPDMVGVARAVYAQNRKPFEALSNPPRLPLPHAAYLSMAASDIRALSGCWRPGVFTLKIDSPRSVERERVLYVADLPDAHGNAWRAQDEDLARYVIDFACHYYRPLYVVPGIVAEHPDIRGREDVVRPGTGPNDNRINWTAEDADAGRCPRSLVGQCRAVRRLVRA